MRLSERLFGFLLAIVFAALLALPVPSHAWVGLVVGVSDGDTISVLRGQRTEKVRLYGVDCPEKAQDFGPCAKRFTSDLVDGRIVDVQEVDRDRYGRIVARVFSSGGKELSRELVGQGLAWVYERYCQDPSCDGWRELQQGARAEGLGLWSKGGAVPPWEFRCR